MQNADYIAGRETAPSRSRLGKSLQTRARVAEPRALASGFRRGNNQRDFGRTTLAGVGKKHDLANPIAVWSSLSADNLVKADLALGSRARNRALYMGDRFTPRGNMDFKAFEKNDI